MATPTISKERLAQLVASMKAKVAVDKVSEFKSKTLAELEKLTSVERVKYYLEEQRYYRERRNAEVLEAAAISGVTSLEQISSADVGNVTEILNSRMLNDDSIVLDKDGKPIQYNERQLEFVDLGGSGQSAVLIGAAGTGKTTCQKGVMKKLIASGRAGVLQADGHKYLQSETPGIVVVSFTRRAVSNIRRNVSEDMKSNCLTIHALLEYEPVYYDILDEATGDMKKTMRFEPTRHAMRPLPSSIKTCVIEEGSMVSIELYKELSDALPSNCQYIFLGDIQQLPPVFGSAILGYKMLELPVVELTEVYRQALESSIIRLAHRILSGVPIPAEEYPEWKVDKQLTIHPWKKKLAADTALLTIAKFLTIAIENGLYIPEDDMVLLPFNKGCGTIELNKHIAQHMARKRKVPVFEIIAGFKKEYLSVGDKVLYDKEDAIITEIVVNPAYGGAKPQPEGLWLDYWGYNSGDENGIQIEHTIEGDNKDTKGEIDIDFMLAQSIASAGEDRVRQASHIITVRIQETDREIKLDSAGDINALLLSFALTVHKSQGSEFRKVFLMLHQSHATMLSRELLYTAVTRAKEELYIICEPESMAKGILSQRIKGNSLAEKAEWFKGKLLNTGEGKLV